MHRLELVFKDNSTLEYYLEDSNKDFWMSHGFLLINREEGTDAYSLSIIDKFFVRHLGG